MPIIDFDFDTEAYALRAKISAKGTIAPYEEVDGRYWHEKQLTINAVGNIYGNATVDGITYVGALISANSEITAAATQIAVLRATISAIATISGEYEYGDGRGYLPNIVSLGSQIPIIQGIGYLDALFGESYASSFVPLPTTVGYGFLLGLTAYGLSVDPQIGEGFLNNLDAKGWLRDVTEDPISEETSDGSGYLSSLFCNAFDGTRLEVSFISRLVFIPAKLDYGIYNEAANSTLNLTSILADLLAAAIYTEQFDSDISLSSVLASYAISVNEFLSTLNLTSITEEIRGYLADIVSNLSLTDSYADYAIFLEDFASTITATDIYELYRQVYTQFISELTLTDTHTAQVDFLAQLDSILQLQSVLGSSADAPAAARTTMRTWAVNIANNASSQYDVYGFTSFAKYNDRYYATSDDGVYELTGDDDQGLPIAALVELALSRFATPQKKYFPSVYLGVTSSGKLLLKARVDATEWVFEAKNTSATMRNQRIDLGKGLTGSHWRFTLLNQNGDDFELESVEFLPFISSRRVY